MSRLRLKSSLFLCALALTWAAQRQIPQELSGPRRPTRLRCEYLINPMGMDVKKPRFSWVLQHSQRGEEQSAYQLLVLTDASGSFREHWDSGKIQSGQSTQVVFQGPQLRSNRTYHWKVRYWDKSGVPSPYSALARFDTGLFSRDDWQGTWITGSNQLRKEFTLSGKVRRARVFVSGLGYCEMRLNGRKVGDHVLDPGWTTYDKRVLYSTYDVTRLLQPEVNAIGVMLGQGWYGSRPGTGYLAARGTLPRSLLLQMEIELEDGREIQVVSDTSWKRKAGPILSDSVYDGEVYDARRETAGWDRGGYDDSGWSPATPVKAPGGELSAQMMPPIRVVDTILPLEISHPQSDVYVFDMGQNFSGWAQLRVRGPRGQAVRMRFAETLRENGMINQDNLRNAKQEDVFLLSGEGEEVYEPRFTYHGFRYVELKGYPGVPTSDTLRGRVVHSAVPMAGSFACSEALLNKMQRMIVWGQKTNLHSVPTDCPQRSERHGWMADAHASAEQAVHNFDMAAFYTNFIRNIRDVQDEAGSIPDTVPHIWGQRPADPAWGAAYPLLCWYLYEHYGDRRILEENYDGLKRYVEFLRSQSEDGLLQGHYYGDWVAPEKTPGSLVSSFYYFLNVDQQGRMAEILGKNEEARTYRQLAAHIKERFHQKYFDPATRNYGSGSQTSNALPLYLDLVPETEQAAVLRNLIDNIVYKHNTHLSTGFIGTKILMKLLTESYRNPTQKYTFLAYQLATQTSYPSWGYMLASGATTVWELWQNRTGPSMNSHNHPALGSVGVVFYRALGGINQSPQSVGFEKIRIEPQPVEDLRYADASLETLRGVVACSWKRSSAEKVFQVNATIPVNSRGEVHLLKDAVRPGVDLGQMVVKEGGRVIWKEGKYLPGVAGLKGATETARALIFEVGSGRYQFELTGQ